MVLMIDINIIAAASWLLFLNHNFVNLTLDFLKATAIYSLAIFMVFDGDVQCMTLGSDNWDNNLRQGKVIFNSTDTIIATHIQWKF